MNDFDKLEEYLKIIYSLPNEYAEEKVYALLYLAVNTLRFFYKDNMNSFNVVSLKSVNGFFEFEMRHTKSNYKTDIESRNFEFKNNGCNFVYKASRDNPSDNVYGYISSQVFHYEKLMRIKEALNTFKDEFRKYTRISTLIANVDVGEPNYIFSYAYPSGHEFKDCNVKNKILDDRNAKKYNIFMKDLSVNMEKLMLAHDIKDMGKDNAKSFKV